MARERWTERWRDPIAQTAAAIFVAALVPRLLYNLVLHPLAANLATDMLSYAKMSRAVMLHPLEPNSWFAFWPFGTGWLAAGVQWIAGDENWGALGGVYALFGAGAVTLGWDVARRVSRWPWIPPAIALLGIGYYPWIMMGGFVMSEPSFTFFLMLQAWAAVRWVQGGDRWDALVFGLAAAVGTVFRPQMMTSVVLTFAVFASMWPTLRARARELAYAVVPIAVMLALSTGYLAYNSGRPGFISHNGSFNLVFGRCHNYKLSWNTRGGQGAFFPAGLFAVHRREEAAGKRGESYWLALDPAISPEITLTTRPGEPGPLLDVVKDCLARTGPVRQARYSVVNVLMLWNGNAQFPSAGPWWSRTLEYTWRTVDQVVFQVPFFFALAYLAGRNREMRVIAANGAAMVLTAGLYFGEIRMRLPYASLVALLSLELLADLATHVPWPAAVRRTLGGAGRTRP